LETLVAAEAGRRSIKQFPCNHRELWSHYKVESDLFIRNEEMSIASVFANFILIKKLNVKTCTLIYDTNDLLNDLKRRDIFVEKLDNFFL
jgi:hypothetical protein